MFFDKPKNGSFRDKLGWIFFLTAMFFLWVGKSIGDFFKSGWNKITNKDIDNK